jgi:hypothetical protein
MPFPPPLAFMFVKPGLNHRRFGNRLDLIEPIGHGRFLRVGFPPFIADFLPLGPLGRKQPFWP